MNTVWVNQVGAYQHPTDLIKPNYPNQLGDRMPIYIMIDWDAKTVSLDVRNYTIDGIPERERYGLVKSVRIHDDVDATQIRRTVDAALPMIEKIGTSFKKKWDWRTKQYIGTFDVSLTQLQDNLMIVGSALNNTPRIEANHEIIDN